MQRIRSLGQGEHHHLEGNHHGEHAEVVHNLAEGAAHAGNIPGCHRGADQDQRAGNNGDKQGVTNRLCEGVVTKGHALDVILEAHIGFLTRQCKGLCIDIGVGLKGVHQHQENRHQIYNRDNGEKHRQDGFHALFALKRRLFLAHYCCTSLSWVDFICRMPIAATRMKNRTAFA